MPRFDLVVRLCAALEEPLTKVFPSTKAAVAAVQQKGTPTVEAILEDSEFRNQMESAGIDMDPQAHTFAYRLRGGANGALHISGPEEKRIWHLVQDDDTEPFMVFDSCDRRIAINRRHLLFCHFLFDSPHVEVVEESTGSGDDDEEAASLLIYMADTPEPIALGIDADSADLSAVIEGETTGARVDEQAYQLQMLFQMLEGWDGQHEPDRREHITDVDGETAWFRLADVAMVSAPIEYVDVAQHEAREAAEEESAGGTRNNGNAQHP